MSASTSREGAWAAIWRHASLPIEPAAPVTSTRRPRIGRSPGDALVRSASSGNSIQNVEPSPGRLAHADPAAELPVIAVALDARLRAQSVRGERWIPAAEFFVSLFTTALEPDEMLVEVALPALPARTGTAFLEAARRHGDYAMLGAAAVVTLDAAGRCERARLVFLNAGEGPVDARQAAGQLAGQALTAEALAAAAGHAAEHEISPLGGVHASVDYQRHLARVLGRRALSLAADRARSAGH